MMWSSLTAWWPVSGFRWSFEGLTVLVGRLPAPTTTLAAHGVIFSTIVTMYQIPQGIGVALCAATGRRIGAGRGAEVVKSNPLHTPRIATTITGQGDAVMNTHHASRLNPPPIVLVLLIIRKPQK